MNLINLDLEQLHSEINALSPKIFNLKNHDTDRKSVKLEGFHTDTLTDELLESCLTALTFNVPNLEYLALTDCEIDPKRARILQFLIGEGLQPLTRLKHLNFSRNPLRERGIQSIIGTINALKGSNVTML